MWYVKESNLTVTVMEGLDDANHVAKTHLATDETGVTDDTGKCRRCIVFSCCASRNLADVDVMRIMWCLVSVCSVSWPLARYQ